MQNERQKIIKRVEYMEEIFDLLLKAQAEGKDIADDSGVLREKYDILCEYYEKGQWLSDFESDERGELPRTLKRGVLSEDGVYNLLSEVEKSGNKKECRFSCFQKDRDVLD